MAALKRLLEIHPLLFKTGSNYINSKLEAKLAEKGLNVSYRTISKHLGSLGYYYKNNVPLATPMLTKAHKEKQVKWAYAHLNDNWNTNLFSDETAFQLFKNIITQWYKSSWPIHPIPKTCIKIFAWERQAFFAFSK